MYVREHNEPAPETICYETIETHERMMIEEEGGKVRDDEDESRAMDEDEDGDVNMDG
jgi:hypothetical protein